MTASASETQIVRLGFKVDVGDLDAMNAKLDEAKTKLDAVTTAVERATQALHDLGSLEHGGIVVSMHGDVLLCTVDPAPVRDQAA